MKLLSFLWVKLQHCLGRHCNHKHLWIRDIGDIRFESELHMRNAPELLKKHCEMFNFITDNQHEGDSWWERVCVLYQVGFDMDNMDIFPILDLGEIMPRRSTYIPQEVLKDIRKAPLHVIGFRPPVHKPGVTPTVVWIHY